MKSLIFGLCVIVIPAFSSTTSCPQGGQLSSVVGCQTFDMMLANVSSSSLASPSDEVPAISVMPSTSPFSELLVSPVASAVSPAVETFVPSIPPSSMFSAPSVSQDIVIPPPSSFESLPTISFNSGLSNSLGMGQVSLGSVILPSQFNIGLPIGIGVTPGSLFDPVTDALGAPEASSVAMIGAGLIFLSLLSTAARKKKRAS
jgi:hypothetical protein